MTELIVAFRTFANAPKNEGGQQGHTERIYKDERMKKRRYEKKSLRKTTVKDGRTEGKIERQTFPLAD